MPSNKSWLSHYPAGVPAEIEELPHASLAELFNHACEQYADLPAYTSFGHTLSYAAFQVQAQGLAAFLQHELGLQAGDRIALMMPNCLQYPIALYASFLAGLSVININPLYTARELKHCLQDSEADCLLILENFAHVAQVVLDTHPVSHIIVTQIGDALPTFKRYLINGVVRWVRQAIPAWNIPQAITWTDAMARARGKSFKVVATHPEDIAFLQYTGGTTGVAKAAQLQHRNIIANLFQLKLWFRDRICPEDTIITALPLYHIFALTANCFVFVLLGGHNVLVTNPRDEKQFLGVLRQQPFQAFFGVNTLFNLLLNNPEFSQLDFSPLKLCVGGGMAVQEAVAQRWKATTGVPLLEGYGLTETSPVVCLSHTDLKEFRGSVGLPLPSTDIKIIDDEGVEVAVGEQGELCVKGPQVMPGYWRMPDEDAKVFTEDGYFKTGDIARLDEKGEVWIVDRKKDMILVSGFNVYPNEVEAVIAAHPDVIEVAVVGQSDPSSGELVKACIVSRSGTVDPTQMRAFCRQSLTSYKVPKIFEVCESLPKTPVGKILRRELRSMQEVKSD